RIEGTRGPARSVAAGCLLAGQLRCVTEGERNAWRAVSGSWPGRGTGGTILAEQRSGRTGCPRRLALSGNQSERTARDGAGIFPARPAVASALPAGERRSPGAAAEPGPPPPSVLDGKLDPTALRDVVHPRGPGRPGGCPGRSGPRTDRPGCPRCRGPSPRTVPIARHRLWLGVLPSPRGRTEPRVDRPRTGTAA